MVQSNLKIYSTLKNHILTALWNFGSRKLQRTNKKTGKTVTLYYQDVLNKRPSQGTFCSPSLIKRLRGFCCIWNISTFQCTNKSYCPYLQWWLTKKYSRTPDSGSNTKYRNCQPFITFVYLQSCPSNCWHNFSENISNLK